LEFTTHRAIYSRNDIVLIDDALSAVDSKVGATIMDKCINGLLASKCVIFVSHQTQYLRKADVILIMDNGTISERGSFTELESKGLLKSADPVVESVDEVSNLLSTVFEDTRNDSILPVKVDTQKTGGYGTFQPPLEAQENAEPKGLGVAGLGLLWKHVRAGNGIFGVIFVLFLFVLAQVLLNGADIFLQLW